MGQPWEPRVCHFSFPFPPGPVCGLLSLPHFGAPRAGVEARVGLATPFSPPSRLQVSAPPPRWKSLTLCTQNPSLAASCSSSKTSSISQRAMFSRQSQDLTLLWVSSQGFERENWLLGVCLVHRPSARRGLVCQERSPGTDATPLAAGPFRLPGEVGRPVLGDGCPSQPPPRSRKNAFPSWKSWIRGPEPVGVEAL